LAGGFFTTEQPGKRYINMDLGDTEDFKNKLIIELNSSKSPVR